MLDLAARMPWRGSLVFRARFWNPIYWLMKLKTKPPVLLVHGDQDEVVPPQSLSEAAVGLEKAGFKEVFAHVMKGTDTELRLMAYRLRLPLCAIS